MLHKIKSGRPDPEEMVCERKEKYRAEERKSSERWAGREKTGEKHRWAYTKRCRMLKEREHIMLNLTEIHWGAGWKWSPLIAFATGIPYSLREGMGGKIAPG